jgi:RNA polymerase sigma-70 factor (ECF subfamily)
MSTTAGASDLRRIAADPDAFESFYREHLDAIHRFVARRVADPQHASDLVADIFLAVIDGATTYDPHRGPPVAWLFGIARNVVADDLRRRAREGRALGRVGARRPIEEDAIVAAQERIDAAAEARQMYAALERLPADQRAVVELVALDGLGVGDAARTLGVQPVTARVRLHRARRSVAAALSASRDDRPDPPAPTQEPQLTKEALL